MHINLNTGLLVISFIHGILQFFFKVFFNVFIFILIKMNGRYIYFFQYILLKENDLKYIYIYIIRLLGYFFRVFSENLLQLIHLSLFSPKKWISRTLAEYAMHMS